MTTTATAIQPVRADLGPVAASHGLREESLAQYLLDGDLGPLAPRERASLIVAICRHIGVDPIEQPFALILDGKGADARMVLYATKACTNALCRERGIDRALISTEINDVGGYLMVSCHARATLRDSGRSDEATGVVPLVAAEWEGPKGNRRPTGQLLRLAPQAMADAIMKAQTKAKRRAVLDLVGLGVPDETEIEHGRRVVVDYATGEVLDVEADAELVEEGLSVETMKAIDVRVDRLAALLRVAKAAVFAGLLRRIEIEGVRVPANLTPAQAEQVLEALDEEIELREQALEQSAGEGQ